MEYPSQAIAAHVIATFLSSTVFLLYISSYWLCLDVWYDVSSEDHQFRASELLLGIAGQQNGNKQTSILPLKTWIKRLLFLTLCIKSRPIIILSDLGHCEENSSKHMITWHYWLTLNSQALCCACSRECKWDSWVTNLAKIAIDPLLLQVG